MARVNILDPNLRNVGGHYFDHDLRIASVLAATGHQVTVIGSEDADPRIAGLMPDTVAFAASFPGPAREQATWPIRHSGRQFIVHRRWAARLAETLKDVPDAERWVWPSLHASHLRAAAIARPRAVVSGVIHDRPGNLGSAMVARLAWRDASTFARRRGLAVGPIGTLDPGLTRELAPALAPHRLRTFARPHEATRPPVQKPRLKTVGVFGAKAAALVEHQREELACAISLAGFNVIFQDNDRPSAADGDGSLRRYGYVADLPGLIGEADLVVLPYRAEHYRNRYSGICGTAIACGVPVLAPDGSSITDMLRRYGTGATFEQYSVPAITARISALRDDFSSLAASAYAAARRWASENGVARHTAELIGEA
jgi:glycosyltransferase involved in cell wall biosynthesis